ncbi:MAG: glycosyltransferase family 2 protein [Rhodothermales bacterium]|nr:glycosyltransferase family 2 protein [Rhodothermales bacterium]MBO6780757.1 glycosyltransferase family 2 protein [Rhodothermales bacterium]
MHSPRVTVAMAAYNAETTLVEAVESILWQTLGDWELLIAEDGSSDGTPALAQSWKDPRIRVLKDGFNRGKPVRMNQMIRAARAPLFAIMDADDIAYPTRLEKQVAFMEAHPEVDLLAAGMATFDGEGNVGRWRRMRTEHEEIARTPWLGFHFNSPTWLGRTEWFERYRYREDLRAAEDEDLLLRAVEDSRFAALPELLLAYRIDRWSWSKARRMRRDHVRSLFEAAKQQRDVRPMAGIAIHGAKLLREGLAVAAGKQEDILAHRSLTLSRTDEATLRDLLVRIRAQGDGR